MKTFLATVAMTIVTACSIQAAGVSAKISGVHLCCQSCVKGVQAAVGKVPGVTVKADKDEGTVTLTGADKAAVQKAADALVAAGYYGHTSDAGIKLHPVTHAAGRQVKSLKVEGVHLCCGKCVSTVNDALSAVGGVKANTAAKNAESFTVTGDFKDKDVFDALQKAGLSGRAGK